MGIELVFGEKKLKDKLNAFLGTRADSE